MSPVLATLDSSDAQCTPLDLASALGPFGTDPCSNPRSHIVADVRYMLERGQDGLSLPWFGSVFVNGPYSDPLPWCERLRDHDQPAVALWKLDTTTRWFALMVDAGYSWAAFCKRLRFERPGNVGVANFASVLMWRGWEMPEAVRPWVWL